MLNHLITLAQTAANAVEGSSLPTVIGVPSGIAAVVIGIYRYVVRPELDAGRALIQQALTGRDNDQKAMAAMGETLREATRCAEEAAKSAENAARSNEKTSEAFERGLDRLERLEAKG